MLIFATTCINVNVLVASSRLLFAGFHVGKLWPSDKIGMSNVKRPESSSDAVYR